MIDVRISTMDLNPEEEALILQRRRQKERDEEILACVKELHRLAPRSCISGGFYVPASGTDIDWERTYVSNGYVRFALKGRH